MLLPAMLSSDQGTAPSLTAISMKQQLLSSAMKRTNEWISAQEVPSDITVHAGGATFTLHKYFLVSKSGVIKKLLSEANDSNISTIEIPDIPGGSEAFELAAEFCYGINFEMNSDNIAMLRCASEYLEMTEDYSVGNLLSRTEAYLEEVVLISLSGAITVLHRSEGLLPIAEKVKLVSRCIDAIAYLAWNDSQYSLSSRAHNGHGDLGPSVVLPRVIIDWWAEELIILRMDIFQRVLMALKSRGFKQHALGPVIMLYAQNSLRALLNQDIFGMGRKKIEPKQGHEKRVVLETVVSLLPMERNTMSVSFLSMLLRAAIYLETTVACRIDLEGRICMQLGQAVLDDLLIRSFSFDGDTMYDVDVIQRIFINYLEHERDRCDLGYNTDDDCISVPNGYFERVGRLMESYLAEVASDPNLSISKFMGLAELIPEQTKVTEDDMYRAIDIYLKVHPSLTEAERKRICSVMDCQRLSREACAHAAQNDRLPVQTVFQVLYFEQQRIRDSTAISFIGGDSPTPSHKSASCASSYHDAAADQLSQLKSENDNLKLELLRMRMQLKEIGKPSGNRIPSAGKPPLPKKSFISSVSKKLGRLSPFVRSDEGKSLFDKAKTKPPKNRRHSIS